jgi:phosphoglycerate-specific signal transduction histidine kinase
MISARNGTANARSRRPIEQAATKTARVQQDLAVAQAELSLTNTVLRGARPDRGKDGDLKKAVEQNGAIEEKVGEAAEELREVKDLLHEEVCERERIELELERRASS